MQLMDATTWIGRERQAILSWIVARQTWMAGHCLASHVAAERKTMVAYWLRPGPQLSGLLSESVPIEIVDGLCSIYHRPCKAGRSLLLDFFDEGL